MGNLDFKSSSVKHDQQHLLTESPNPLPSTPTHIKDLFPEIIFSSLFMREILNTVAKIARSHSSVLILGESGTGKELVASAIHRLSPRSHKCFVAINCSAIPEDLLEAELFGHEKGAYTGADRKRIGHFGVADGGTVFLDEIGDMPLRLQAKLLRVLQERKFSPIGSREVKEIDIRIIAATNIDLEQAVKNQTFRLDLFYRLNVLPITLPPLRERKEDISLLLDHFIHLSNRVHPHAEPCWMDERTKDTLCSYDWPGNVRELQNLVERLVIMSGGGRLSVETLPEEFKASPHKPSSTESLSLTRDTFIGAVSALEPQQGQLPFEGIDLCQFIEGLENSLILQALERTNNNKNQAAKLLGLNRTTLVERLKKRKIFPSGKQDLTK